MQVIAVQPPPREEDMSEQIHETVRQHYANAALSVIEQKSSTCCEDSCGCADSCCVPASGVSEPVLYSLADTSNLPDAAILASLGCGNPVAVAELREGERVLDLGSGGGMDSLLSARRVGPTGRVFGLDMTDEMLALAQRNKQESGVENVEFLKGVIEDVPLPQASIDVVISNCVINLASNKQAVFGEIARVLRPGGRLGVADIVADDSLTPKQRAERGSYAGCIAGALSVSEYESGLATAGLTDVSITRTHEVAEGMYGAIVRATKP